LGDLCNLVHKGVDANRHPQIIEAILSDLTCECTLQAASTSAAIVKMLNISKVDIVLLFIKGVSLDTNNDLGNYNLVI
jgi:hypothetical protein